MVHVSQHVCVCVCACVCLYMCAGDMGGVLFGAAVLLHLTGYEQQQPLMHHLQTLLATATLQSASAATTDTRTATTAATSGWKGTPPSRGKATDTRQYGRRISGGGGAAAPRAPRAVVVSMAAAARIMADWEVACCHAACLKTSHATWSVAPAPAAAGAEQASLAAVAAAASQESAPDQMWLPAPPVGGMQGLFGAEHTAGMGRGGNGPMQAKMRAAAWGYQVRALCTLVQQYIPVADVLVLQPMHACNWLSIHEMPVAPQLH